MRIPAEGYPFLPCLSPLYKKYPHALRAGVKYYAGILSQDFSDQLLLVDHQFELQTQLFSSLTTHEHTTHENFEIVHD